jgi:hypothetical protein
MDGYLTNNTNNNSNDELVEAYPELYLVYSTLIGLSIFMTVFTIMCFFPIECTLALTVLLAFSKTIIKRKHLTFFDTEYDQDIYPDEFYKQMLDLKLNLV